MYEPFPNINSALFEVSVKDSSYSSLCVYATERLHTSITCDIWIYERDLFFITETLSLEAVVKEESMNYPLGTTGPCHKPRTEEKGRERKGKGRHSTIDSGGIERLEGRQKNVSACARDPAHCRLSLCPVNWNTKQSGVDERAVAVRRGGEPAVCLLQRSTFTARWELTGEPASETDTLSLVKWTVTLHFSSSWQHRIGRFEPCDVTLIEFWFSPLLGSKGRSRFNFKCTASPCKVSRRRGTSASDLHLCTKASMAAALFFLTTPHYFIVLLRYSASQLVLFFLGHIVMAVWQAHGGGKLLGVAIWILEAIPGSIKTLTLAKSLVSLSYYADGVGKGCSRRGDPGGWGFRSAAASRSNRAWLGWGMVVKNLPGWAKKSLSATTKEGESVPFISGQRYSSRLQWTKTEEKSWEVIEYW